MAYKRSKLYKELSKVIEDKQELDTQWKILLGSMEVLDFSTSEREIPLNALDVDCRSLMGAFMWSESPQGGEFWSRIEDKLAEYYS